MPVPEPLRGAPEPAGHNLPAPGCGPDDKLTARNASAIQHLRTLTESIARPARPGSRVRPGPGGGIGPPPGFGPLGETAEDCRSRHTETEQQLVPGAPQGGHEDDRDQYFATPATCSSTLGRSGVGGTTCWSNSRRFSGATVRQSQQSSILVCPLFAAACRGQCR